jgi:hypothetical protein
MDQFHIPADYNSDEEASENEPVVYRQGQRAVTEIFKHALDNRTTSKKAIKNHSPEGAAPGTNDLRHRWYNMFIAFFQTLNLP